MGDKQTTLERPYTETAFSQTLIIQDYDCAHERHMATLECNMRQDLDARLWPRSHTFDTIISTV